MRAFHINLSGVLARSSFPDLEPFLAESLVFRNNTPCSGAFSVRRLATRAPSRGDGAPAASAISSDGAASGIGADAGPIGSELGRMIRSL